MAESLPATTGGNGHNGAEKAALQASSLDDVVDESGDDIYSRANPSRPGFTKSDQKDMWRMGRVQEFKRNYRPLSALSFATVLTAVWEYLLM